MEQIINNELNKIFTGHKAAMFIGASESTIRRLANTRQIEFYRVGNRFRFKLSALEKYINNNIITRLYIIKMQCLFMWKIILIKLIII